MDNIYCKAGRVELSEQEAHDIYNSKKYVVTSYGIFQPHYSQAQQRIYFNQIATIKGLARRGRFYTMTAEQINNLLGENYLLT